MALMTRMRGSGCGTFGWSFAGDILELSDDDSVDEVTEINALKKELQSQKDRLIKIKISCSVPERLLWKTKEVFVQHKISKEGVVETFDNISSQIQELANRQLEHIPVGFRSIIGVISGSEQSKGLGAARLPKGIVAPRVYLQKNRPQNISFMVHDLYH
ncbi:hypothetical protein BT96DRAFT_990452 [Gymnopus androsaceus JB14]|uniref:Uncharacterized protein n=1 Tax=Gymnopus androsaceus JB14 TaxID=1447944 RepID=A0A6A4HVB9_9AGAR|nr:hypothetical protein BT96DRAFT_990452 [Gymnopus androsaceus JB14]